MIRFASYSELTEALVVVDWAAFLLSQGRFCTHGAGGNSCRCKVQLNTRICADGCYGLAGQATECRHSYLPSLSLALRSAATATLAIVPPGRRLTVQPENNSDSVHSFLALWEAVVI